MVLRPVPGGFPPGGPRLLRGAARPQAQGRRRACPPGPSGRSMHCHALGGAPPPSKDPAALLRYAPLQRLQREIWLATARTPPGDVIRLSQLSATFDRYNDARATQADARRRRQDPLSAAIYAATVVGWRFQNLTTLATQRGAVCLHTTSEAELRRHYFAAWQRRQERLADAAWERRGGLPPGQRREPDTGASATQRRAGTATPLGSPPTLPRAAAPKTPPAPARPLPPCRASARLRKTKGTRLGSDPGCSPGFTTQSTAIISPLVASKTSQTTYGPNPAGQRVRPQRTLSPAARIVCRHHRPPCRGRRRRPRLPLPP